MESLGPPFRDAGLYAHPNGADNAYPFLRVIQPPVAGSGAGVAACTLYVTPPGVLGYWTGYTSHRRRVGDPSMGLTVPTASV